MKPEDWNIIIAGQPGNVAPDPHQGWTAPAKPTGMAPWSRNGQRPCQGSPGILLFELTLYYFAGVWPCQNPPLLDQFMGLPRQIHKACPALIRIAIILYG